MLFWLVYLCSLAIGIGESSSWQCTHLYAERLVCFLFFCCCFCATIAGCLRSLPIAFCITIILMLRACSHP